MKNKIIIGVLVLVILIISFVSFIKFSGNNKGVWVVTSPLNATYIFDQQKITLQNGKSELSVVPGSASKIETMIFGIPTQGDLNGDGVNDYAMFITQNTGGSGTFYYAAVALTNKDTSEVTGLNTILLGDRIAPQNIEIQNGEIIANYADRKPGEPMTSQPSVGVSKYMTVINGVLQEK